MCISIFHVSRQKILQKHHRNSQLRGISYVKRFAFTAKSSTAPFSSTATLRVTMTPVSPALRCTMQAASSGGDAGHRPLMRLFFHKFSAVSAE
jgi:hypothetical protein